MNKIRAVLGFEYRGYIKSKAFIVTTIVFVAVVVVVSQVPRFMGAIDNIGSVITGGDTQTACVELTGEAASPEFFEALSPDVLTQATAGMYEWVVNRPPLQIEHGSGDGGGDGSGDAGATFDPEAAIEDEKFDVVVVYDGGAAYELYGKGQDFTFLSLPSMLDPLFTAAAQGVKVNDIPEEQRAGVQEVLGTTVAGDVRTVGGGSAENNFWLAYVMLYVLFMSVIMYGQFIVNAVINEKSSKMMELLVTSARPIELMFGKVFGVGMAAFTQIGALIAAAVVSFVINYGVWMERIPGFGDIMSQMNISVGLFVFFVMFFVAGYFLYAFICAAVGSTASRVEDAGSVSTLPMMLAMVSFLVSMISMSNIEAVYVEVLSYIPFFAPWIMFARLCMASATFTEAAISMAILVAAVVFFGWLAAKIYRIGVMMYGKPMKLTAIVKAALRR